MVMKLRKIKRGKAKDYQRDAKYYDYYYIVVDNKHILLHMNGWSDGTPILRDETGDFILVNGLKYYLDYSNI